MNSMNVNSNSNSYNSEGDRFERTETLDWSDEGSDDEGEAAPAPEEPSYIFYSWDPNNLSEQQSRMINLYFALDPEARVETNPQLVRLNEIIHNMISVSVDGKFNLKEAIQTVRAEEAQKHRNGQLGGMLNIKKLKKKKIRINSKKNKKKKIKKEK